MMRRFLHSAALSVLICVGAVGMAAADTASSSNYMVSETQFGSGSALEQCSGSYCARSATGDLVNGQAKSDNYGARFGSVTTADPYLEVYTSGGLSDLGTLDIDRTATATAQISVRNYMGGYVMQITGRPPSQGSHELKAMDSDPQCPCTSQMGAEQFGINFIANTAPSVGANPTQVPSNTFSFGQAATDYDTPNLFKYVEGDIVAQSNISSGQTDYTLSMIFNVSNVTPGGQYTGSYSAVVVPTY